ncbi:MAG: four helix bundle protein [Polyangiaceae bacterium]
MDSVFPFQQLDCYVATREFARLVQLAPIADSELRDQVTRAAKSAFLNVSEGLPSQRIGVRRRHFEIARGSLGEAVAGLDLALALGALSASRATELNRVALRLAFLIGGLLKRR